MFYLLTNKQIIEVTVDTEDIILQFEGTTKEGLTRYLHWKQEDGIYDHNSRIGQIQKSSTNKYNLVEIGDLIIGNECGEYEDVPYIVTSVFDNIDAVECGIGTYLEKTPEYIRKVFKLDQDGNYIRVI